VNKNQKASKEKQIPELENGKPVHHSRLMQTSIILVILVRAEGAINIPREEGEGI